MYLLIYILVNVLIIGLFLYSKLTPYKDKLTGKNLNIFLFFDRIFKPVLTFFGRLIKPHQVGTGIAVDMTQIVLLVLFLVLLKFLS